MIHTIETRLKLNTTQELLVDSCVVLWSSYYRKTWKLWNNQQLKENEIYHQLMGLNLFTSRQIPNLELSNLGNVVESAWTNNPTKRCVV